jgi:ADP-ribosylglycohydrolase
MNNKKAWQWTRELVISGVPFKERMGSVSWDEIIRDSIRDVQNMNYQWKGYVTDSLAQLFNIAGVIQAKANLGYDMSKAEAMLEEGKRLYEARNEVELYKHTLRVYREIANAPEDPESPYWKYTRYTSFGQYVKMVDFPKYGFDPRKIDRELLFDKIYANWLAQTCAGALGTALEGFHTLNIEKVFGTVDGYIKEPEQYNDDITFQLVFLEIFSKLGYETKAADIAEEWAARIPIGFTAEGVALRNIKQGIYPPQSGTYNNPMCEWIGAQMRGAVCGLVAPGDPETAARLAFEDGIISHTNTGVLGEVLNAVMTSLAFVENDCRTIARMSIDLIPCDSMFRSVLEYAWDACKRYGDWRRAWLDCDDKYQHYNWIAAIPNAAAEVVALYFCENDYDKLCSIIAMCGLDVDCNAAQVAGILAVIRGSGAISPRWSVPVGNMMITYVRGMERLRFDDLARKTMHAVFNAWDKKEVKKV